METKKEDPQVARAKRLIRGLMEKNVDRGATEQEALEAAAKVSELMERFELELTDVMVVEAVMVQDEVYAADRWAQGLVTGIGRLCSLVTYNKGGESVCTFIIYGHRQDIELAKYLYEVCCETLDHDWAVDGARNGSTRAKRESFRQGFAERVRRRMVALREARDAARYAAMAQSNSRDLVVLKDQLVKEEFAKTGTRLVYTKQKVKDTGAYSRGQDSGSRVNLNNPLENARKGWGVLR